MKEKIAIVLFNLGGPDGPEAVRPFLFNLFNDPAILSLPRWPRWALAHFISWRRAPKAKEIYKKIGGGSPLLANTKAQANALESLLPIEKEFKVFIAMRYWNPLIAECVQDVKKMNPDRVVLLPLYPQFSTTTTGSSYRAWIEEAKKQRLNNPHHFICCYPDHPGFIDAVAALTKDGLEKAIEVAPNSRPLVIFSAHGLPKKVIVRGDPYQAQIEVSAEAVAKKLNLDGFDWKVSYQSRVGPLEWIGPSTEEVIKESSKNNRSLIVVPIAFVSEHSETLVELDIDYRHLAEQEQAPIYIRVPTVSAHPIFIRGLTSMVLQAIDTKEAVRPGIRHAFCQGHSLCPYQKRIEIQ